MITNPHIGVDIDTYLRKNKRLIHSIANKFRKRIEYSSMEYEDLVSLASIGFCKAYERFDPTAFLNDEGKGVKFSTYAVPKMIGEIQRYLRDDGMIRHPRSVKELATFLRKEELIHEKPEEILKRIEGKEYMQRTVELRDVKAALEYIRTSVVRSMEETVFADDGENITLQDTVLASSEMDLTSIHVSEFVSTLDTRLKKLVELRVDKDLTQSDVGKMLGVSQVQVSRLMQKVGELYVKYLEEKNEKKTNRTEVEKAIEETAVTHYQEVVEMPKGDLTTARKLLEQTDLGYREISRLTGCTLSVIGDMGKKHRPAEIREANTTLNKEVRDLSSEEYKGAKVRGEAEKQVIDLLESTEMTYGAISEDTGVSYARVAYFGPKFRSEQLRKKIQAGAGASALARAREGAKEEAELEVKASNRGGSIAGEFTGDRDKAVQLMAQGGYTYKEVSARTGVPTGSLTKLRRDYQNGTYEWENPPGKTVTIQQEEPKVIITEIPEPKTVKEETPVSVQEETKTIGEAINEYTEQVKKEAIAEFVAEPKTPRTMRRNFNLETEGTDVTVEEALLEINDVIDMVKGMRGDSKISFTLKVRN